MTYKDAKLAGVIVLLCLIAGLIIKYQTPVKEPEDMKTTNVTVELTDEQYAAIQRDASNSTRSARWETTDEINMIAQVAVRKRAQELLRGVEEEYKAATGGTEVEEIKREQSDSADRSTTPVDCQETTYTLPSENNTVSTVAVPAEGCLTASKGVHMGPSGRETWYDLPMGGVIDIMRGLGYTEEEYPYWVREDGVRMFGSFVMVAVDTYKLPKGTIIDTSLGEAMCVDHCPAGNIDIAVTWAGGR